MRLSVSLLLQGGYAAYRYAQPAAAAAAYSDRYPLGAVSWAGLGLRDQRVVPAGLPGGDRQAGRLLGAWGCAPAGGHRKEQILMGSETPHQQASGIRNHVLLVRGEAMETPVRESQTVPLSLNPGGLTTPQVLESPSEGASQEPSHPPSAPWAHSAPGSETRCLPASS